MQQNYQEIVMKSLHVANPVAYIRSKLNQLQTLHGHRNQLRTISDNYHEIALRAIWNNTQLICKNIKQSDIRDKLAEKVQLAKFMPFHFQNAHFYNYL